MCFISFFSQVFLFCVLFKQLLLFFEEDLDFLDLTPQNALFGFINESDNNLTILQNHILLIFKLCYQSRERGVLYVNSLIKNFTKVKKLETRIASDFLYFLYFSGGICLIFFFMLFSIFGQIGGIFIYYLFFLFHSKLVMFLLNSCKVF